tara:strand:- start:527 stop:1018 length:492 start_codon:yes stop_codon:yes gene_type:complete
MNYLQEWVDFYRSEFPQVASIPPMPQRLDDIKSITVKLALENYNQGKLFQNLFGNSGLGVGLPADVQLRLQQGNLLPQDAGALRAANLPHFAEQCEALGEAIEKQQVIDETTKLQEINAANKKRNEAWSQMDSMSRLAASPLSEEQVAQARAAWGISGQPTYD